jgi:membrane protease YdiL (CAAX protease family)
MPITAPRRTAREQSHPPRPRTQEPAATPAGAQLPQYSRRQIAAVWGAATLPMALLAWIIAPWLAHRLDGPSQLPKALLLCLTAGLIWQFVLVVALVAREQRSLRWARVREALWLNAPRSPRSGRRGGRLWLAVLPCAVALAAEQLVPQVTHAANRDFGMFLGSHGGHALLSGSWGWFTVIVVLLVFNTVLGEELLFRGLLLPRMNGAFGSRDWVVNGALFALYHVHTPWVIPGAFVDIFAFAYPAKRYRSALVPIVVHSLQSVFLLALTLSLVMG